MADKGVGEVLLSAQDVMKSFGAQPVLENVSISVHEGERIGLIGRNGTGKSTLLRILAGLDTPDRGTVTRRQRARVAMLSQQCALPPDKTVGETLREATRARREIAAEQSRLAQQLADAGLAEKERAAIQRRFEQVDHEARLHHVWEVDAETDRLAAALDLPARDRRLGELSGGELRRVDLVATLLQDPDVLLLDEPTNHIDTESARWIEDFLRGYEGSCVLVTHDRYFLDLVVTRIVELDRNRLYTFPGNYERFLEYKTQLQEVEARTEANRQSTLRRELEWLRRGPKARGTKQKARIQRYEDLAAEAGTGAGRETYFEIPRPHRLGKRVLEADQISYVMDGRTLFDKLTLIMQAGMRVGIAGPNGCGKTTLLRVLMGQTPPTSGAVTIGESTEFLYVDQAHEDLEPDRTVLDYVSGGANYWELDGRRIYVPGYLERLLFDMDSVRSPVKNLSGGERNRMVLAKKLLRGGNFLVLDEPTNDLDLATLRVLEEAILAFDGCALLMSHDRYFLNRLATHMIVFEGDGQVYFSAGNYDDYLRFREERDRKARDAAQPPALQSQAASAPRKAGAAGPKRLTYMEQRELEGIEEAIESAEAEVARLEEAINRPGFYEQDHAAVQNVLSELQIAREKAVALYERWEELDARAGIR